MALLARAGSFEGGTGTPRRSFAPSRQQAAFLDHVGREATHVLLEARAGSGKSTTCREAAWRLHAAGRRSLYCCFNAQIARDFRADLPSTCRASTLHSLGFGLVRDRLGDVRVDEDKVDRLAEKYFPGREGRPERRAVAGLVGLCKNLLADGEDAGELRRLAATFDVELPRLAAEDVLAVVPEVLRECADPAGAIDFDDMVWLPVRLGLAATRSPDVVFIDEAQDLNPAQHALLPLVGPDAAFVVVGDRYQSIYAWRGADAESIPKLEARLADDGRGLATFPLTVTRRCPRRHVELARTLVRDLDHLPDAIPGEVGSCPPEKWTAEVDAGDMVLCRTNAPLVSACYRLIRDGRRAFVRGRDIGRGLLALIARLRCRDVASLLRAVGDHRAAERAKLAELRNPGPAMQALDDKCDCLIALCDGATSIDEVRRRAEEMFSDLGEDGAVVLSSIHRAKGLEAARIVVLRPDLLPGPWATTPEAFQQEKNLTYVAATRAREALTFAGPMPEILT